MADKLGQKRELESKNVTLSRELSQLRDTLKSGDEQVRKLSQEVTDLREKNTILEARTDSLSQKVHQLNELQAQSASLSQQVIQFERDKQSLEVKYESIQQQLKELEYKNVSLEAENISFQDEIKDLQDDISKLRRDLKEKQKCIESLKEELEQIKKQQANSQKGYDLLYLSQTACFFEQAICEHVLPEVFLNDRFATFGDLLNYVNGDEDPPFDLNEMGESKPWSTIREEAKQRWGTVCDNLKLSARWKDEQSESLRKSDIPSIFRAVSYLKRERIAVAHPQPIHLNEAKEKVLSEPIKASMPKYQYKLVKDFIQSLPGYISKGGLSHEKLFLD